MTEPTREQLLHLADRARRGVLLPAEGALLADAVTELEKRIVTLEAVAESNKRHVQLIVPDLERAEAAIERVWAWIAGEPVTARSEFGSGYREALRDITDALDQPQQPTTPETGQQRDRVIAAIRNEYFRRIDKQIVASPDEHIAAFATAAMSALTEPTA